MSNVKILEIAAAEIGVKEFPANSNKVKYNTWFYGREVFDGDKPGAKYPWCGTFVSWVYYQVGISLGTIDYLRGFAGCDYAIRNLKKWGRLITVPQAGDIVMYDWNGDGKFDHTGIFVKDLGKGYFEAIEGNTAFGNDSNGGEVMRRADRKYKNTVFIRPIVLENIYHDTKNN